MRKKEPEVTQDLLEYLDEVFPDRCPQMDMTDREVWASVGRRDVISHLKVIFSMRVEEEMDV